MNWRNHRKVVVIDGRVGYIGGMNVADRYVTGEHGRLPWRDTHLRLEGGVVKALQFSFAVDWNFMKRMLLTQPTQSYVVHPDDADGMQVLDSGPTGLWNGMSLVFLKAISLAKTVSTSRRLISCPTTDSSRPCRRQPSRASTCAS